MSATMNKTASPVLLQRLTGLERMRKVITDPDAAPPIGHTLNFRLSEVDEGRVVFTGEPTEAFLNPAGTVHGGWAATLLDSALSCCVYTTLSADEMATSVEFKVNLIKPILTTTGPVACEGRVVQRGRRLALSEATLKDENGVLLAHGTETSMIMPLPE